jgi:hypothetical protein
LRMARSIFSPKGRDVTASRLFDPGGILQQEGGNKKRPGFPGRSSSQRLF